MKSAVISLLLILVGSNALVNGIPEGAALGSATNHSASAITNPTHDGFGGLAAKLCAVGRKTFCALLIPQKFSPTPARLATTNAPPPLPVTPFEPKSQQILKPLTSPIEQGTPTTPASATTSPTTTPTTPTSDIKTDGDQSVGIDVAAIKNSKEVAAAASAETENDEAISGARARNVRVVRRNRRLRRIRKTRRLARRNKQKIARRTRKVRKNRRLRKIRKSRRNSIRRRNRKLRKARKNRKLRKIRRTRRMRKIRRSRRNRKISRNRRRTFLRRS